MDYNLYKKSRDMAWKILIDLNISSLPISTVFVAEQLGFKCLSYNQGEEFLKKLGLLKQTNLCNGFSLNLGGKYYIFYDEKCTPERIRFTIAHEIGHIVLGHLPNNGGYTRINREPNPNDNPLEQQANIFASRLLAPACVLKELNVSTAADIARICSISTTAAEFRFKRLNLLIDRNKFLTSSLERQVYENFKKFINDHRFL